MKIIPLALCSLAFAGTSHATNRPNVLFIGIDDLRPELGCYGSEIAVSPNLDKLASQGLLFNNAYCQQPICGPSRASLMTGGRPDSIQVTENFAHWRQLNPNLVAMPQHFIANGYNAVQIGKIYHNKSDSDPEFSWNWKPSKVNLPNPVTAYMLPENQQIVREIKEKLIAKYGPSIEHTGLIHGPAYECADVPDEAYRDGYNVQVAIATMKEMAKENKPFFLGMGFYKPHLEFSSPKRYWDLYNEADIPLATETNAPRDGATMGLHASFELRVRDGIPKTGSIGDDQARTLRHAYLSCVSYIDAQVGKIINALDEEGLRDNTIIIVWGDHGWHLGDMGVWGKATNYEIGTHVPMMVWTPDMPAGTRGKSTDALVELVDLYPSLCDLAGLSKPSHLEGCSFKPLLTNPALEWKTAAFSQFPCPALREWAANPLAPAMRETFFGPLIEEVEGRIIKQQKEKWNREMFERDLMGYAMRTDRYRLIVWKDTKHPKAEPIFIELYDHLTDPKETVNVAKQNPERVATLLAQFNNGWKGSLPSLSN